jgi:hypothetical protein
LKRFLRAPLGVGAVAAVGLWLGFGALAAQAGVRIVAPANEAIVPTAKVRVALAAGDAGSLRVSLDGSNITRRLAAHGRLRAGVLRGRLVRPGAHWLRVRWRPAGGGRQRTLARRFMVARRSRSLASVLFPRRQPYSASGVVRLRLAVARGVGLMRVRVNGRRAHVRQLGRLWPTLSLTLGARHGLRFGRNRVRVLLHDFRRARYDVEALTVVVRRSRPLAAGIARYRGEAGGRAVRLDGRGARPTRPGRRLRYSWRIVRRPRGSRARLLNRLSARPRLPIDVRGRYRLALRVSERPGRRRGDALAGRDARAAARRATSHRVTVLGDTNTRPIGASLQIDLTGSNRGGGAITIDDVPGAGLAPRDCSTPLLGQGPRRCVYPAPQPEFFPYLLVLDALTLEPKAPIRQLPLASSDFDVRNAIEPWVGQNVIAILVFGGGVHYTEPQALANFTHPAAYIFRPTSDPSLGIRSGWFSEAPTDDPSPAEISGFFQKSWPVGKKLPSEQYQFVPGDYVQFDTSKAAVPGQNTIVVGGKEYTSQLTGGAADGFQVLVLDKTLTPMFGTPSAFANGAPVADMAALLRRAHTTPGVSTVFVQSIGRPTPAGSHGASAGWNDAAGQIDALGGNTDVFLSLGDAGNAQPARTTGWYSLVAPGGPPWQAREIRAEGPSPAIEASAPLTQRSGDLSGVLRRNQSWQYEPTMDEVGGENLGELLRLAYQPPSQWPYSDPASRDVLDYLATYKDGAVDLRPLGLAACYEPGPKKDVRSSYCNINEAWATIHSDLGDSRIGHGGKGAYGVCGEYPGKDPKTGKDIVPVDPEQYAAICDRIALETEWLADLKDSMKNLKDEALGPSVLTAYLAVLDMTDQVRRDFAANAMADHNVTADALEIAAGGIEMISIFLPPPAGPAGEFLGGALSLAGEITSLVEGEQGESAVHAPVTLDPGKLGTEMQKRVEAAGTAFDHIWDMLISDPAKLEAAYENFELNGIWTAVPDDLDNKKPMMRNGVRHWAAGKFMAATYDVWQVSTFHTRPDFSGKYRDVTTSDLRSIVCAVQVPFASLSPDAGYYFRDKWGLTVTLEPFGQPKVTWDRRGNNIWILAQSSNVFRETRYYPPQSLLSELYSPPDDSSTDGGYGWERPWLYSKGQRFVLHAQDDWANNFCEWFVL